MRLEMNHTSQIGIQRRAGAPSLAVVRGRRRNVAARTSAPEAAFDRAEADRLSNSDAFAELVRMNGKQSVNRPQKVRLEWRSPSDFRNQKSERRTSSAPCAHRADHLWKVSVWDCIRLLL